MYTGCHCPVTAGQKGGGGGGVGKWTSVTPRGRKPIFPHPSGGDPRDGRGDVATLPISRPFLILPPALIVPTVLTCVWNIFFPR